MSRDKTKQPQPVLETRVTYSNRYRKTGTVISSEKLTYSEAINALRGYRAPFGGECSPPRKVSADEYPKVGEGHTTLYEFSVVAYTD